jgi:integrase
MIANATPKPRWTLSSCLQEFLAAEYQPYKDEQAARPGKWGANRRKYLNWIDTLKGLLGRRPKIADLTQKTVDECYQKRRLNIWTFRQVFYDVWKAAHEHVPELGQAPHTNKATWGVVRHGPCKWTKAEMKSLLGAANRIGGSFRRRLPDGSVIKIPRALWFAAYVRVARVTSLPWKQIENIRNGDITTGGMIVARPPKRATQTGGPKAWQLGEKAMEAIQSLRGEPKAKLFGIVESDETLRVYFRRLCDVARLEKSSEGYQLIFGNCRGLRNPEPSKLSQEPIPLGRFTLDSPLAEFVEHCYLPQKIAVKSDKTREHYGQLVKKFTLALGRSPLIRDLTEEGICRMLRYLESCDLSPHTCKQRQHYAVALANFCSKHRIINWWVELPKYPAPDVLPTTWTVDEMKALFAACKRQEGRYCDVAAADWWRAFHCILWDCGERTSAVRAIQADWLNTETRVLAIPGPARKGGRKAAVYELTPQTIDAVTPLLEVCRATERALVFAFPGCDATFYHHYRALLKSAGLPSGPRQGPQKIRRTFATFVELAGGSATEALMHSCRRVTVESYIDPTVVRKPAANLLLPDLGLGDAKGGDS